ncbi:protachykinin-1 isoform X1 [Dunckerocampus dactyliophorus]|uniref:protachykinin-1 isoform X1 n=1 Tax=Dunckerocampus dactyliophorus TaxID=161453 RepID=UPI002405B6AF|nr:protachykinin-1 isoform X1 [Dunckerocampus dactyliophorus]
MARSGRGQPPHWPSRQFRFQLIAAPIPFEQIQAANNFGIMHLRLLTLFMLFLAVAQLFCEDNLREDDDLWTTNDHVQHGWPSSDPFREILLRMTRKPRPHQFVGLMGRRSMANSQIPRKRCPESLDTKMHIIQLCVCTYTQYIRYSGVKKCLPPS